MQQPELGKKIADLRKEKGLTQEELIRICNLSIRTLQRIESGEVLPRSYTLKSIFKALDFTPDNSVFAALGNIQENTKPDVTRNVKSNRGKISKFFNLKKHTMKKLSILSVIVILGVSLAFNVKVHSQSANNNQLLGTWKLISYIKVLSGDPLINGKHIKIINPEPRFLEFKPTLNFETRNRDSSIYNMGNYNLLSDSLFVTAHLQCGEISKIANLYEFKINNDTLHFKGFYLSNVNELGEKIYKTNLIDEWWVKVKP